MSGQATAQLRAVAGRATTGTATAATAALVAADRRLGAPGDGQRRVSVDDTAGIEAVARWLCLASEYHEQHWRLYLPKARDVIDTYTKAMASAESVD